MKINEIIRYILSIPKILYFNFKVLPFKQAICLPIIISYKTKIISMSGKITLEKPSFASVKVGFGETQTTDFKYHRSILNVTGDLIFKGRCKWGIGSKIEIKGKCTIGKEFNMTGNSTIICHKQIDFGDKVLISWEVLIMDSDQHNLRNRNGEIINNPKRIKIDSNVWIGARSTILKGVHIGHDVIIAANSLVSKSYLESNTVIGGNPAKKIKSDVVRD
jgi:acetyltransferase-like isoleucine patch superfamily enzyme